MGQTFAGMNQSDPDQMGTGTKLTEGGTKGLLQGFSNMQGQNAQRPQGGGNPMAPPAQAGPVSPDYFAPQAPVRKPINNNFYGGGM